MKNRAKGSNGKIRKLEKIEREIENENFENSDLGNLVGKEGRKLNNILRGIGEYWDYIENWGNRENADNRENLESTEYNIQKQKISRK